MTIICGEPQASPSNLRNNRDFQVVIAGQAISALGDAITLTAMPLLVLFLTGSGVLMGVVGALQLIPDLVLGLLAGALADRWDRRQMIIWSDAGRAVLTATIPLSFWLGVPTMAVILIVVVPINALRVLSDAGLTSAIPGLVGRENLARASSYFESTLSVPFIIGPAIAGLLVATIGPATTLAIDAVSFVFSAGSLLVVRRTLRAERAAEMPRILVDIKDGLRFVWRHVALRSLIGYWGVMVMVTATLIPALAYYITVGRGFGPELFGFVGSASSVGYLIGSLLAGRLSIQTASLRMLACGVVIGVCPLVIAVTTFPLVYIVVTFCTGAAIAGQTIAYLTLRPGLTPDELLGRVGSTARAFSGGLQLLGLLTGGALLQAVGGGVALITMGGLVIVTSLLFGLSKTFRMAGSQT